MRGKATSKDKFQRLLSEMQALKENYGVRFIDVHIFDIVKNTMFSNFWQCTLELHIYATLEPARWCKKTLKRALSSWLKYLDNLSLYVFSAKSILSVLCAADAFVRNNHKSAPFLSNCFYKHAKPRLDKPYVCNLQKEQENF